MIPAHEGNETQDDEQEAMTTMKPNLKRLFQRISLKK
jgi:hypothetical protein